MAQTQAQPRLSECRPAEGPEDWSAYVKRVSVSGATAYATHAADGTFICLFPDEGTARAMLALHGFTPLSVH